MKKKRFSFKIPQWSSIKVIWQDAFSSGGDISWREKDEPHENPKAAVMIAVGLFYMYDSKNKTISICRNFCPDDSQREGDFVIPIGCIKEFIVYEKYTSKEIKENNE